MMKRTMALLLAGLSINASANPEMIKAMIAIKARQIAEQKKEQQAETANYRLVLFYSNRCPYCVKFAPVVQRYSEYSKIKIEPVSLTQQTLPEFPNSTYATQDLIDLAYQGKPVVYPALFVANTKTHKIYPVSFGFLEASALEEKMNTLLPKIKGYERNNG